jgi:sirohydrochlorin cobaltochelatase
VESYPEVDIVINELSRQGVTGVHLMPLMLVAGDHAINDMASDEDDSWKTRLMPPVFRHAVAERAGENPAVRAMFVAHLQQALNNAMEVAA